MNSLNGKTALVTGGSRGIGRGIVTALTDRGAHVWALARNTQHLDRLKQEIGDVDTLAGDATDEQLATKALCEIRPDIVVLNAGATPVIMPLLEQSWEQFNLTWETDVKSTFFFGRQALLTPLAPGSIVVIISSGSAFGGAPLSGSYAGAKRMQWMLAQHLQQEATAKNMGIRFVVLVPKQIVGETELGNTALEQYARQYNTTKQAYLERMGTPFLTAEMVGQGVAALLTEDAYQEGLAFAIDSKGLSALN